MRLPLVLLVGLLAGPAMAQDARKELDRLQGTWQVVSLEVNGEKAPAEALKDFKLLIKGDRASHQVGETTEESLLKLDPSRNPRTVDFVIVGGTDKGKTMLGIYKLEGDMLTFCVAQPGTDRPREFGSKPKSNIGLIVLRRDKN
jgi:uncharacterized protein (TIGR03067 family)